METCYLATKHTAFNPELVTETAFLGWQSVLWQHQRPCCRRSATWNQNFFGKVCPQIYKLRISWSHLIIMMKVRQSPAAPCAGYVRFAPLPQIRPVPHAVCGAHRMTSRGNFSRGWFYGAQASKCSVTSGTRWVLHHGVSSLTPGQRTKLGVQITSPAAQTERCTGNHWARTWMRSGTGSPTAPSGLNHVISSVCSHSVTPNCFAWSPICPAYFWSDKNEDFCRVTVKTHNSQKSHLFGAPHFIINRQFNWIRENDTS